MNKIFLAQYLGSDVAVKKLLVSDESIALKEFVLELSVMLLISPHENLVMLKGFTLEPRCIGMFVLFSIHVCLFCSFFGLCLFVFFLRFSVTQFWKEDLY